MAHAHGHEHRRDLTRSGRMRLTWALVINLAFLVIELVGGLISGSLALLADAGHMATDVAALGLAVLASHLALRAPTSRHTFGLLQAEVLGAFVNGAALVLVVGWVLYESMQRFRSPQPVDASVMIAIAVAGLLANAGSAFLLLHDRKHNLNIRGAFLHLAGDTLSSIGVVIAGIVIWATGFQLVDPIISIFIALIILVSTIGLLRDSVHHLLGGMPPQLDYDELRRALLDVAHVTDVYDLHVWAVAADLPILTAHLRLEPGCSDTTHWQQCLRNAQLVLHERFHIVHSTLQLEPASHPRDHRTI